MADNERKEGGTNPTLGQQPGEAGRDRDQTRAQTPEQGKTQGDLKPGEMNPSAQKQGDLSQGGIQSGEQGFGAPSGQLGEQKQTFGASSRQDATGGQGPQQANLDARGQTGVIGAAPAQSQGQPTSPSTGGPNLSEGLKDQNSRGGS